MGNRRPDDLWMAYPELKDIVIKLIRLGFSPSRISRRLGINSATVYKWQKGMQRADQEAKRIKTLQNDPDLMRRREELLRQVRLMLDIPSHRRKRREIYRKYRPRTQEGAHPEEWLA